MASIPVNCWCEVNSCCGFPIYTHLVYQEIWAWNSRSWYSWITEHSNPDTVKFNGDGGVGFGYGCLGYDCGGLGYGYGCLGHDLDSQGNGHSDCWHAYCHPCCYGKNWSSPSFKKHRVNHFVMRHCFLPALLISKL